MRYRYHVVFLLLIGLLVPQSAAAQTFFTARLTAAQQPSGVDSDATGTAALALTEEGLRFFLTVDGLSGEIANAHFHRAPSGENGGVVRGIADDFTGNTASGMWTASDGQPLTDELIQALFAGELYFNIHTAANPGGEIRGQIYPTSGTGLSATLTAAQQPAGVTGDATGTASVQLTDDGVLFFVTVDGLSGDIANAHFHRAPVGANGGVVRGIAAEFVGNTAVGLWTATDSSPLTDELVKDLLLGRLYINIHTATNPGGEIRGQVRLTSDWGFSALLDTAQQPNGATGDGTGTAALTLTAEGLVYQVTVAGLTGDITNAHFHRAPAGENGGVVHGIFDNFVGNTASGVWHPDDDQPLTEEFFRDLIAGNIYINIHTAANPGGEIRGQVLLDEGTTLSARLTPAQQPGGAVTSDGTGTATLTLTDEGVAFQITVDGLSGDIANAHFHQAPTGGNGSVVRGIAGEFTGNTASGIWTASDAQPLTGELIQDLLLGNLYFNIHTAANPGGEIRGQIFVSEGAGLRAFLTSAQQPGGGVTSDGTGTAALTLTGAGLAYQITVNGLSGDIANAHFHGAPAGENGGVVHGIFANFVGNTASGVWRTSGDAPLTDELIRDLLTGNLYINIHTAANPGGEIRGQVGLAGGIGAAVQIDPGQQPGGGVTSDGTGTSALTLTEAGLVYDVSVTGLTGPVTNAHFHQAPAGQGGGVVHGIFADFVGNTASGAWRTSGDAPLTAELTNELLAGNFYINVHTAANPGGEIRGQVLAGGVVATAIEAIDAEIPGGFTLAQNYPNPFNPATTISFTLDGDAEALLTVYNLLGQQVATIVDRRLAAGAYQVTFDARGLPTGVYYYQLEANGRTRTQKMILMK